MTTVIEQPLRILSLADVAEDPDSGAAGAEYQTIAALRALGHTVDPVWADTIGRRIQHGNLHYLFELPRRYEEIVAGRLSRGHYDVVHVNQPHGYRAARLVRKRWPSTVSIHRSHGFEPRVAEIVDAWSRKLGERERRGWRRAASSGIARLLDRHNAAIARWADGHLLCSTEDAEFLEGRFGVPRARIAVIPHAAPDSYLETAAPPMTAERLRRVLYVGQFAFVKAPMIVAAAMNRIVEARADASLEWIAARAHHERIVELLSPAARARLDLRDWMPQEELRARYDSAGVFLFPSFFEGTGKASIEAMSRGLCVVASNVGGMRDMIEDGRNGVLVAPGDANRVADEALRLMADLPRAHAMSAAAAARARQFHWRRTAIETAALYRSCLAAKREVA